jgi:bacteriocin-like protein
MTKTKDENHQPKSETRQLSTDELNAVNGGTVVRDHRTSTGPVVRDHRTQSTTIK